MWREFLTDYNAKELYSPRLELKAANDNLFTDSSDMGYGGTFRGDYVMGSFPKSWLRYDIQVREFFPIYLLVASLANKFTNSSIFIRTDNTAVASAINLQTSRNPTLMFFVRKLVRLQLKHNIMCVATHIPGHKNSIADALSRLNLPQALTLLRNLGYDPKPLPVPAGLRPTNWRL